MQERFNYLLDRYRRQQASPSELQEFYQMLSSGVYDQLFMRLIDSIYDNDVDLGALGDDIDFYPAGASNRMLQHILANRAENLPGASKFRLQKLWPHFAIAAAAVLIVIFGFWLSEHNFHTQPKLIAQQHTIVPGSADATLTLSNGKKIILSAVAQGELANEGGVSIKKSANGQLLYQVSNHDGGNPPNSSSLTHTLTTAKGQTFQVRLPDSSLVFLNAASSLTYTSSLVENGKRVVRLQGEGYFKISKDKNHPFVVKTARQEVEVLGTQFNISSYANEDVEKTTLLEGSVRMTAAGNHKTLKPGEQGKLQGTMLIVEKVDTDMAVAWKNNEFLFKSESIEGIMKMVERWYNVEVIYLGEKTNERFSGSVSRFEDVTSLLAIIESTKAVHFKIEGRKIYVKN